MIRRIGVVMFALVTVRGVVAAEPQSLSFRDAVTVALAHNGDLLLARNDVDLAGDEVALARSAFDHQVIASSRAWRRDLPGDAQNFESTDRGVDGSLELTGHMVTGTSYSVGVGTAGEHLISPFLTVHNPAYTTGISATITQPLLRGAWRGANRQPIVVASLRRDLTEQQLRVKLEQIVGQVEAAYWTLALAHKELDAREASLKLAKEQLGESTRLVRLGTISDLDVLEAKAGVGRADQQLIRARRDVADSEGKLYLVIGARSGNDAVVPSDDPEIVQTSYSITEHVELARRNRPDVAAARALLGAEQAALAVTANDLKPQVDLVLGAGLIGFAGEIDRGYGTAGVLDNTLDPPYTPDPDLDGGLGRAFKNLTTGKYFEVSVGLKIALPLENRAAKARHDRQRHSVTRARITQQTILERVDNEVRTSITLLQQDEALQKAADEAVVTNEKLLVGMRKRFAAGAVTSFDVLRVADELTRAQIEAARARVSYRIALARLAVADGTLLERYKIGISSVPNVK